MFTSSCVAQPWPLHTRHGCTSYVGPPLLQPLLVCKAIKPQCVQLCIMKCGTSACNMSVPQGLVHCLVAHLQSLLHTALLLPRTCSPCTLPVLLCMCIQQHLYPHSLHFLWECVCGCGCPLFGDPGLLSLLHSAYPSDSRGMGTARA